MRHRSRWGLAALLLLLLGAAGYWALADQDGSSSAGNEHAVVAPPSGREANMAENVNAETSVAAKPKSANTSQEHIEQTERSSGSGNQDEARSTSPSVGSDHVSGNTEQASKSAAEPTTKDNAQTATRANVNAGVTSGKTIETSKPKRDSMAPAEGDKNSASTMKPIGNAGTGSSNAIGNPATGVAGSSVEKDEPGTSHNGSSNEQARVSPDVHLAPLDGLVAPFMNNAAATPGPLLQGDSTPAYVLKKGNWWLAAQGDVAMLNASWKGTGREVAELNQSETWRGGQGLSVVAGRTWLNGWSVGLGIGVNKQRSSFLRRQVEAAQSETVVDTTWVGTPMGTATNYTWDIVETQISEPGVERDYSATNSYMRLRIAPEVSYDLLRKKRLTVAARLAPVMMFDIGRKGNTVIPTSTTDSLETMATTTGTWPLNDASVDERFPMALAISTGLELRYRLCDSWSVGLLPAFTYWIPQAEGRVPSLSMNELGGALRLRYDLRHKERRVK